MLDELERWRYPDGTFTLKIVWPDRAEEHPGDNNQIWKQSSNPVTSSAGGVEGYQSVDIHFTAAHWCAARAIARHPTRPTATRSPPAAGADFTRR